MSEFSPEDRAVFSDAAADLYEEAVETDGIAADDPRLKKRSDVRPAFDLLLELGLLLHDPDAKRYRPVDPASVQARVVAPMSQKGAELINESAQWAQSFGALAQAWRRSPAASRGPMTELRGLDTINSYIVSVVAGAETELLTAQPQATRTAAAVAKAAERDIAALDRGLKMRTLYQHSARRMAATHKYVLAVERRGAEVRTLDEFFNRLIVVDRRIAIIPGSSGPLAMAIREPMIVEYLVDLFERHWERARPYINREQKLMREVAKEQRAMTIRMLIEGHADPASAKRLGVSPRTYAGYISDLKVEYDAETRFQLGYTMGRLGVAGEEDEDDDEGPAARGA
ncbi:LuxR family transcriptional regulator [Nocardioides bigeumensis]|uniref:Helix-turn-helix transcriptional regulator n=1 Tax=Nocardioides bigeumensis TaxID=433657 RepID=A0ABN2YUJ9_9ACTN